MDKSSRQNHGKTAVRGLIVPTDWDENGRIREIALMDFDEDIYYFMESQAENLKPLVRKEVEILGRTWRENDMNLISVNSFRVID